MAEIAVQKKSDLTWLWAIAAIASVVALMVWLFVSRPVQTAVVTETATDTTAEVAEAEPVELSALSATPQNYVGREVSVSNVAVAAPLGQRVFWADVPGASPVLVVVGPVVEDVSWINQSGSASLRGTVEAVTPQQLDQLVQSQALLPEGRSQAEFATHYLSVTQVQR